MSLRLTTRLLSLPILLGALHAFAADAPTPPVFKSTPAFEREVMGLIGLLENYHYNRNGVRTADYAQLIPDYMTELDGQRLFFLESDKDEFNRRYPARWLYNNVSGIGKIDPAFEIFAVFQKRIFERVAWISQQLQGEIDLTAQETYNIDRAKLPWPKDAAEADALWMKRLKFDVIQEVLNKKTPAEARQNVAKRYDRMLKNFSEIESFEVSEMFLSSLTRMFDPHSTYFSAATFEDFGIQMRLKLEGIGAILALEDDYCVVKELKAGCPADLSKQIKPNDKILAVAQDETGEFVDVVGMKLRKIVAMVRGKTGSKVRLLIQPGDAADPSERKTVTLIRDVVNIDSARARGGLFDVPDATNTSRKIGVITLPSFYGPDPEAPEGEQFSATKDVAKLIAQLKESKIEGLVLDLRNNGGGILSEAVDLAGLFIPTGPVVQVRDHYGNVKVDKDEDPGVSYHGPLIVLVSKFSASASEIVAGALQNYGRAIIMGDSSTHGKGSVQTVIDMRKLLDPEVIRLARGKVGATKLTVQKFYLPDGHSTQLKGVVPDIILPSFEDLLPVGEKDLPHALVWDEIPKSSFFDGKPLEKTVLDNVMAATAARQKTLEEFTFLQKSIDWFKSKQENKEISLNLDARLSQKEADTAFHKLMKEEKERLSKAAFPVKEFYLGTPPAPRIKPTPAEGEENLDLNDDDDGAYGKLDIHLREALRILTDLAPVRDAVPHESLAAVAKPAELSATP